MTKTIQFTQLGNFGRFGNQMFQYAFARAYAEKYDAVLETPAWIGEKIFKLPQNRISKKLPRMGIEEIPWGEVNIDFHGYFQTGECFNILSEKKLREWFVFRDCWLPYLKPNNKTIAHLRRGDFITLWPDVFCIVDDASYIQAIQNFNLDSENLEYISEEKPTNFEECNKVSYSNTGNSMYGGGLYPDSGVSFLPDFLKMINSKVLLRSNSSFSFWAGFLKGENVYSPVVRGKTGWNTVDFVDNNFSAITNVTDNIVFGG